MSEVPQDHGSPVLTTYVEVGVGQTDCAFNMAFLHEKPSRYIGFDVPSLEIPDGRSSTSNWYGVHTGRFIGPDLHKTREAVDYRLAKDEDSSSSISFVYSDGTNLPLPDSMADEVVLRNVLGDPYLDSRTSTEDVSFVDYRQPPVPSTFFGKLLSKVLTPEYPVVRYDRKVLSIDFGTKMQMLREAVRIIKPEGYITVLEDLTPEMAGLFFGSDQFESLDLDVLYISGKRELLGNQVSGVLDNDSEVSWEQFYHYTGHRINKYSYSSNLHVVLKPKSRLRI